MQRPATGAKTALVWTRWTLILTVVVVVLTTARPWAWSIMLVLPLVFGTVAVHFFPRRAYDLWLSRGVFLLADTALVGLALAGTPRAWPMAHVGLFCVLLFAVLTSNRIKSLLGSMGLIGLLIALGGAGSASFGFSPIDALFLPVLLAAALHFGRLSEHLVLHENHQRRDQELWALLDITDTITSTLDVPQVMHSIVEKVGDLVETPSCSIVLADSQSPNGFVVASKGHPEAAMLELDLHKYPEIRYALNTRQVVVIEDVAIHPLVAPVRELLLSKGYRSLLVLPLMFGKEVLGALFLRSGSSESFSSTVLRFCKVAACVSANALKNAMLYRDVTREAAGHRETGEKLRRVLDGTPDIIVATDDEGCVTEFNRGAEELTGWTLDRAMRSSLEEILGSLNTTGAEGGPEPQDVSFLRPDGETVEVSLISAPLNSADGRTSGRVWIGRDVTRLRRVERNLAQAERLSSLGEVVAGVAHELNNPLSGVVGYAELLRATAEDPSQLRDLQRIVESAMRCQKIVFKLLSFARKHPPEKKYQSVNECVQKVLDLKSYHLRSSQIETVLELDGALPDTCFDFHQLEQVILNMLNNAEQAVTSVKKAGRIVLRTGLDDGRIFLDIEDDGPGVPDAVAERIFDPFFTTKQLGQGTGLGLSVSYGIVQEHGGHIEVRDARKGSGACFHITLPVIAGDESARPRLVEPQERPAPGLLRGRRVLVAEDDPVVLELLHRLLTDEGALVTLAQDGREAWLSLEEGRFDLVIADLRMPNLSGQQLYEKVAEERPEMLRRFVFATGDLVRQDTLAFLEGLPNRILTKPLQLETVRRVLSQAISSAA